MRKKNIIACLLCALVIFSNIVFAASQSDLNDVIKKKNQIQQNINNANNQKNAVQNEYNVIEANILSIQQEIDKTDAKLNELDKKQQAVTKELDQAKEKEKKQEETFKKRLRVMYEDGTTSYFKVLLSSKSIFDFFYNIEILKQISENDERILKQLTENKKQVENKKTELDGIIAEVQTVKNNQQAQKNALKIESDKKVAYMNQLQGNIDEYKKSLQQAEAEENKIRAEIAAAARAQTSVPVQYSGGTFQWPVPSTTRITSYYATTRSYGTVPVHRGIDIGAYSGSAVVAAADGVVIKATYNSSYGNYVSINHGGGVVTLYAHNSSLKVSAGQSVKRGQQIAVSGNTGHSLGPHVHFEVMINGATVNPLNYF